MTKFKENGLIDLGKIELDGPSDAMLEESPELELAKQMFCVSWTTILAYLLTLKARVKNPILRFLFGTGLSIIDGLYGATCNVD